MEFLDQCNRSVVLDQIPRRIVSLVPSQTEFLYDLGLENEVLGITKFCIHPKSWFESKKRVGGTKSLHIDKIRELEPDLIIANKEENIKEEIENLANEFPVWISDIQNLNDTYAMMQSLGEICSREKEAKAIIQNIQKAFREIQSFEKTYNCLYLIWKDPYMLGSTDTFISSMLDLLGVENAASVLGKRYPVISEKQIEEIQPDLIFLSTEPYPFNEEHVQNFKQKFPFAHTILVDGEMFSWYGSRLMYSAEYLQNLQGKIKELMA